MPQKGTLRFGARCLGKLGLCMQFAFLAADARRIRRGTLGGALALRALFVVLGARRSGRTTWPPRARRFG
jgi:hypothetical protein